MTPGGDGGNDGIAHAVNHRYRPATRAGGIIAAVVGDVDLVGQRVYRHAVGIESHIDNTLSVNVGFNPYGVAVNSLTNKIYVANHCGNDPACASGGTVSVIDGVSNTVVATVTTGSHPYSVAVNSVTNNIYVSNNCGNDL